MAQSIYTIGLCVNQWCKKDKQWDKADGCFSQVRVWFLEELNFPFKVHLSLKVLQSEFFLSGNISEGELVHLRGTEF